MYHCLSYKAVIINLLTFTFIDKEWCSCGCIQVGDDTVIVVGVVVDNNTLVVAAVAAVVVK